MNVRLERGTRVRRRKPMVVAAHTARPLTLAVALVAALLLPFAASAENRVVVGVVGGQRTAETSAVAWDRVVAIDGRRYQLGRGTLVVDDASGTNAGWRVMLAAADGTPVTLLALDAPVLLAGQAIDAAAGPVSPPAAVGELAKPRVVLAAAPGYGKGRYAAGFTVARELPAGALTPGAPLTLAVTISPAA